MCRFLSVGAILFVTMGSASTTFAYDSMGTLDPSTEQVVMALLWLLVIILSATVYYHSKNMNSVLLYSGIALSVCVVIIVTGQPPLPGVVYATFSRLGVLPALLLLVIVLLIIGREVVSRIPRVKTQWSFNQASTTQTFSNPYQYAWNSMSRVVETLYHGTPEVQNVNDILNYGFLIGSGNSCGSGLYLADLQTAKGYTKGTGGIMKIRLDVPSHQVIAYSFVVSSPGFAQWQMTYGTGNPGEDITNYAVKSLKKRFVQVSPTFYVALANITGENERVVIEGITILGVLDAQGNPV